MITSQLTGFEKIIMVNEYYDGLVMDTDRNINETEDDIKTEKERCEKISNWEDMEKLNKE